jgi:O-antigen/teichoic acid export membrane protein
MNGKQLFLYLKKTFLSGSLKTIIVSLSTIILLPLIIQKIGIERYGLLSLTMVFGGVSVFADFGISKSVTILIGRKGSNVNAIISNALFINATILMILACIFIYITVNNFPILGDKLDITNDLKHYIVFIGFVYLSFVLLNNLLVAILEAFFLVHYVNVGFMFSSVTTNAFIFGLSLLSESLYLILMAPILSIITVTLYFIFTIKRHTQIRFVCPCFIEIKLMLSLSFKFMKIGMINSLIIPINKYLIIYTTGSSALLGVFDIGLKLSLIALSFLNSITQPLMGVFSNANQKKSEILSIAIKVSSTLTVLYIVGIAFFHFIGMRIIEFMAIDNYKQLYAVSFILILGVTFSAISEPFYKALLGTERLKEALYLKLSIPIINVCLYFILQEQTYRFALSYSIAIFSSSCLIIIYFISTHKKALNN